MRELYIRRSDGLDAAVVEDGHLVEYLPADRDASAEAIYLGRVERVMPGMKAAFIQIGQEKNGFLPLEERNAAALPKLQVGMSVLVQVRKEAQGVKGAFLSRDICLCGEYVLFSPLNRMMAVSSRITRESDRKALKALAGEISGDSFGLVMRTAALHAPEEAIRQEVEELRERWETIRSTAPTAHVPSVLYAARSNLELLLADYRPRGIDRICTNAQELVTQLSAIAPVTLMGESIFEVGRITTQMMKALDRQVWLESGGNLVFDPCEAMTVIDVNTARFTGKRELEDTVLKTNLEACEEIARQVRLRNISGIIVIDMIDMVSKAHHQSVLDALERAFAADRVKTVIHGFTSLGLVEMTRKRSRPPLRELMKKESHQLEE
ncbi:MAG: ribonuclease E/G [Clostridiales bacterium]|nr:ribonuclease E/G [Clostridiales bacterium]